MYKATICGWGGGGRLGGLQIKLTKYNMLISQVLVTIFFNFGESQTESFSPCF